MSPPASALKPVMNAHRVTMEVPGDRVQPERFSCGQA